MKILHVCLAAFYIDNYGYQENILPKMHKLQGHNVSILASTETYIDNKNLGYVKASSYLNSDGIPVRRIPYTKYLPKFLSKKLRIYPGVTKFLQSFKPDILFLHDVQFISIYEIVRYVKQNPKVKLYIDGHTDFINSGKNFISKYLLHGLIYKWCAKIAEPFTQRFYGVLPLRNKFFHDVYNISLNKIELLPLGADNTQYDLTKKELMKEKILKELNLSSSDFLIITGGKIDKRKNINALIEAIKDLGQDNIKLILFGQPNEEMKSTIEDLINYKFVKYLGWLSPEKIYSYLIASDLAVFPGTHSVLWEQSIGIGLPTIFKKWPHMEHLDLGGNCLFLDNDSIAEIKNKISSVYSDPKLYSKMSKVALDKGVKYFSYYDIAKRAIEN